MGIVLLDCCAMLQMDRPFFPFEGTNTMMKKYSLCRTEPFLFMLGFFKALETPPGRLPSPLFTA